MATDVIQVLAEQLVALTIQHVQQFRDLDDSFVERGQSFDAFSFCHGKALFVRENIYLVFAAVSAVKNVRDNYLLKDQFFSS